MIAGQSFSIEFYVNNRLVKTKVGPQTTALSLIREQLGLTGSKESCAEGDCGACTIAWGRWCAEKFTYLAVNACILPATKLHGSHVLTIEGLATGQQLHIIQRLILEYHATQCGYCTPGVIMSLFCLFANNHTPTQQQILAALEGNLCRCTGYQAIGEAANAVAASLAEHPDKVNDYLFPEYVYAVQKKCRDAINRVSTVGTLPEHGTFINGGTDLMVAANIHHQYHDQLIDISNIAELKGIELGDGAVITIGGAVTFTEIQQSELIQEKLPILIEVVTKMASTQIRNVATIAGNIANASPIADAACALLGMGAKLILKTSNCERKIALEDFYLGYKKTSLIENELIYKIEIPLTIARHKFEKTSKRIAVDIAAVNSMSAIKYDNDIVMDCRIAFGGVAPYPALAKQTAAYLTDKKLTAETIKAAAEIAQQEFQPITDVRGSDDYRSKLIYSHVIKHLDSPIKSGDDGEVEDN